LAAADWRLAEVCPTEDSWSIINSLRPSLVSSILVSIRDKWDKFLFSRNVLLGRYIEID